MTFREINIRGKFKYCILIYISPFLRVLSQSKHPEEMLRQSSSIDLSDCRLHRILRIYVSISILNLLNKREDMIAKSFTYQDRGWGGGGREPGKKSQQI